MAKYKLHKKSRVQAKSAQIRQLIPVYWRQLIEWDVPIDAAKQLAEAIAEYDVIHRLPNAEQRQLMNQYCRFICRCGLWRSEMLLLAA
jgi:hypothetical protein